jgi:hypothetical protein
MTTSLTPAEVPPEAELTSASAIPKHDTSSPKTAHDFLTLEYYLP